MKALPLSGRRILVTRAAHQAGKLSEGLRALGAEPIEVPVIEIQPPSDFAPLDRALRRLDSYDWLILTSANTVRALVDRAAHLNISMQKSAPRQVAGVGEATAEAARHAGLAVALVPESYVAESLIAKLLQHRHEVSGHDKEASSATLSRRQEVSGHDKEASSATLSRRHEVSGHDFSRAVETHKSKGALAPEGSLRGQRIFLARAAIARDVIPHALRAAGATVDVVDAYQNVMPASAPALLHDALHKGIAAAAFTSSSSVTHLADAALKAGVTFPFAGVTAISIGPITSRTLRDLGWEPAAEASPSDVPGLIDAVLQVFSGE